MEDRIVLSKIREMLENRLEGVKIENFSQILDILHALIDDYSKIYKDLEALVTAEKTTEQGRDACDYFKDGESLQTEDKFDLAAAAYQKAIELKPDYVEAYLGLAVCLAGQGNDEEALPVFRKAIKFNPDEPYAHFMMGISLSKLGEDDKAIVSYKKAVKLDPEAAFAYCAMGTSLRETGKFDKAIGAFRRAIDLKPDAIAFDGLGITLGEQGKYEEAIEAFEKAITLGSNYASTYYNLGSCLCKQGRYDDAEKAYRKAVELRPDYAAAFCKMGDCFYEQDKYEDATDAYRRALQMDPDNASAYFALGNCLYNRGSYEEALDSYGKVAELEPESRSAYYSMGNCLYSQGNYADAVDAYRRAITLDSDYPDAYYFMGLALDELGEYDESLDAYQKAFQLAEDISEYTNISTHYIMFERGNSLSRERRYDKAVVAYQIAVQVRPDYVDAWVNMSIALGEQGKYDEAIAACRKAIELKPDDADAHGNLGVALTETGRYDEAVEALWETLRLRPEDAFAYDNIGVALTRQGQYGQAMDAFQKAVEINPGLAAAYHNMGTAYIVQGKYDDALGAFRKAVELNSNYALALYKISICLSKLDRHDEALAVFKHASELSPDWAVAFFPLSASTGHEKTGPGFSNRANGKIPAKESRFCLIVRDNRLYYADSFSSYVLQINPFPAAWVKKPFTANWRRTRDVPLNFRNLFIGRLHREPMAEFDFFRSCQFFRWKDSNGPFQYEPDWEDSIPLKLWTQYFDWEYLVKSFFGCVPETIMEQLNRFPAGCWELLEAAYNWDGFLDLLTSNPALAVCLAMRMRVGGSKGERRKRLDYGGLVRLRQREISAAVGFGDSESAVTILKKIVPDACTPRELHHISFLINDPETVHHLQEAKQISGPAISIMGYQFLQGRLGGGIITEISRLFPLTDDILSTAEGVKLLRGGAKQQEFMDMYMEIRDLARYNPEVVLNSIEDFRAKHAAMVKKLNSGAIDNSKMSFPDAPFRGTEHIQPIATPKDLALEGKEMNHCIGNYGHSMLDGDLAVYRVTYPERATLALERGRRGWYFGQLKLKDNRDPSAETVAIVEKWLKENKIRKRRNRS